MHSEALPPAVAALIEELGASSRLVAHLTLVHDVARRVTTALDSVWIGLTYH